MTKETLLKYAEPLTIVLSVLALIGVLFTIQNAEGAFFVFAQAMFFITFFLFPAIVVFFGRLLIVRATPEKVPPLLFPLLFLYTFIPTISVILPYIASGFRFEGALELVFVIFEIAMFLGGFGFFVYFFHKYLASKLGERDLTLFLHYFVGGLVYFYFIRLTLLTSILIQSAFDIIT